MNQLYPAIAIRNKMTGFEGVLPTGKDTSRPPYMIDFNNQYIFEDPKSQKFKIASSEVVYTYRQMIDLFSKDHDNLD
jgi:hypothetical protein